MKKIVFICAIMLNISWSMQCQEFLSGLKKRVSENIEAGQKALEEAVRTKHEPILSLQEKAALAESTIQKNIEAASYHAQEQLIKAHADIDNRIMQAKKDLVELKKVLNPRKI